MCVNYLLRKWVHMKLMINLVIYVHFIIDRPMNDVHREPRERSIHRRCGKILGNNQTIYIAQEGQVDPSDIF